MRDSPQLKVNLRTVLIAVFFTLLFAQSYTQRPLYSANQHTYMLQGLAEGGLGFLSNDWMVSTADPFPLFSFLTRITYTYFPVSLFYLFYSVLQGVFVFSLLGIASRVWGINRSFREVVTCFLVITFVCSALFSDLTLRLTGMDLRWVLQSGLADQYILGPVFQPSTFGVFLLLSIYLFLSQRPYVAVFSLAVAASFHTTYLLSAASLTLSYMLCTFIHEKDWKKALLIGSLSLLLVSPVVIYSYITFSPTSAEVAHQARNILVDYRIPHHANVTAWFDRRAFIQISIIVFSLIVLFRKRDLWVIILVPFIVAVLLSGLQMFTGSKLLALLFPWRISTFLVPLTVFAILSGCVAFVFQKFPNPTGKETLFINLTLGIFILGISSYGVYASNRIFTAHRNADFVPMMKYVEETKTEDDLYLIPTQLLHFRLMTGAPVFIDMKTHPYKDTEVVEWYKRIRIAHDFYGVQAEQGCEALLRLASEEGITHVVTKSEEGLENCPEATRAYGDSQYFIYEVRNIK